MRILITGGCGFLGSNIAYNILANKIGDLFIMDNLSRNGTVQNLNWLKGNGLINFYKENIQNKDKVAEIIDKVKPDFIYHLAGQVAMTTSIENPRLDFEINTIGTLNVLEAVRLYSKETTIIYSSTNKVYGDFNQYEFLENDKRYFINEKPNGFDEKEPLSFHSPYGCSKGAADQYLQDYYRLYGINTIVFRHSSMYGGRQFSTFDQGWVGWFCQKALEIKNDPSIQPFTIAGNGKQVRDLLYSEDAVNLYIEAMKQYKKITGNVYNIGGGMENSYSILELFSFLEKELSIKMKYEITPVRQSDQKIFVSDNSKIQSKISWNPKVDKQVGLRLNLDWSKSII